MSSMGGGNGGEHKRGDGRGNRSSSKDGPPHNTRNGGQQKHQRQQGQVAMDSDDSYGAGHQQQNSLGAAPGQVGQYPQQMAPGTGKQQAQGHIFRNAQASKQMVYEVYGNTIAMLEEVEAREMTKKGHTPLPRSDIHMVSQQQYDDSTCLLKLETQLLLFQNQMKYCDQEIRQEVRDELTQKTVMWNSIREHQQVPKGVTDTYVGKLIEVLTKGKTEHPKEFYETPTISESEMKGALQGIMLGQHRQSALDDDYRQNPDKKATAPNIRTGEQMDLGAERVTRDNPHLSGHVDKYGNSLR